MPPLEHPETALKCLFLAGRAGDGGQGTASSRFDAFKVKFNEPLDYWKQLGKSIRQQVHSSIPPSVVSSGLGLGCVCVGLPALACRWEGLSDGDDIWQAFLAFSGEP